MKQRVCDRCKTVIYMPYVKCTKVDKEDGGKHTKYTSFHVGDLCEECWHKALINKPLGYK